MNKKFSTLMALALVAGGASAQNWKVPATAADQGAYRTFETKSAASNATDNDAIKANTATNGVYTLATGGEWTKNVFAIDRNLYYQLEVKLADTDYPDVLVQERDYETGKVYLRVMDKKTAPLNASLWRIEYSKADGVSGGYFRYINKETGLELTFDHSVIPAANDTITELRAGIADWSWNTVNKDNNTAFGFKKVYSYLHNQAGNEVMYLSVAEETDKWEGKTVADLRSRLGSTDDKGFKIDETTSKYVKVKVVDSEAAGTELSNLTDVLEMKPVVAAPFFMTAKQFNTRMDADDKKNDKSFKFTMNKELVGADVLLGQEFLAIDQAEIPGVLNLQDGDFANAAINTLNANGNAFAASTQTLTPITDGFKLKFKTADGKYLLADTARYQETTLAPSESPAVKFALKTPDAADVPYMKARYYFRATYFPTNDSILIEPLNAAVQADFEWDAKKYWKESAATTSFARTADYSKANTLVNDYTAYVSKTVSLTATQINGLGEVLTVAKDGRNEFKVKTSIDRPFEYLDRATVETGLYFINLANHTDRQRAKGMNIVKNMAGNLMYDTEAMNQKYDLMPSTMWTVEQLGCEEMAEDAAKAKYVKISNREYPGVVFEGQLYSKDGVNYRFINRSADYAGNYDAASGMLNNEKFFYVDSLNFTKVTDEVAYTSTHGYKMFTEDQLNDGVENNYNIKWNNFMNDNVYLQSAKDKISYLDEASDATFYEIAEATWGGNNGAVANQFGEAVAGLTKLDRKAYVIKVKDNNLIDNNRLFIASVKANDGRYYYQAVKQSELNNVDKKLGVFYLKANQVRKDAEGAILDTCYVLVDINKPTATEIKYVGNFADAGYTLETSNGWMQAAVEAGYKMGNLRDNDLNDKPNDVADAFYGETQIRNQYIDLKADKGLTLNSNIKFFNEAGEYLYEDCGDASKVNERFGQEISEGLGYLAIENKTAATEHAAIYVDEVQVSANTNMPQYIFGVRVDSISNGFKCKTDIHGYWVNEEDAIAQEGEGNPAHYEEYAGYTAGHFLVNLNDSINKDNHDMLDLADPYKMQGKTRLAFIEGIHATTAEGEVVYLMKDAALKSFMTIKDNSGETANSYIKKGFVLDYKALEAAVTDEKVVKYVLKPMKHDDFVFSLRKVTDDTDKFLLESNDYKGNAKVGSFTGAWVQILNNVPVLAQFTNADNHEAEGAFDVQDLINHAQIFSLEATDEKATANEGIETAGIKVIAGNGVVTVKGAAGKNVVITNVLGQQIANTVASSDEATIATPAGVVVVAVEGEAAVKAIVK